MYNSQTVGYPVDCVGDSETWYVEMVYLTHYNAVLRLCTSLLLILVSVLIRHLYLAYVYSLVLSTVPLLITSGSRCFFVAKFDPVTVGPCPNDQST